MRFGPFRSARFWLQACVLGAVALFVLGPARAEDAKPKPDALGTSVELPYLIAPLMLGDKLFAYAYVSSKIIATSPSAAIDVRERTPFIQDAFVRDVNRKPIGKDSDPATVDSDGLRARLLADARMAAGPARVKDLRFIQIQITPVRSGS